MKQCKKRYNELKPKFLHKPLDEIDFGLGWREAFMNIQQWLMGRRCTEEDVLDYVNKELG